MADPATFVAEFHAKNQASLERHLAAFKDAVAKESLDIGDFLRLTMKDAIEAAEVAALWFGDCENLSMKLGFAEQCGSAGRHCRLVAARIAAVGGDHFDPRTGGYSRFFGFLRSLTTPEERSAAAQVTLRTYSIGRLGIFADLCDARGDADTATLFRQEIIADERRVFDEGWGTLIASSSTEESQARGRRAAFRIVELAGESGEPLALRKALSKRRSTSTSNPPAGS